MLIVDRPISACFNTFLICFFSVSINNLIYGVPHDRIFHVALFRVTWKAVNLVSFARLARLTVFHLQPFKRSFSSRIKRINISAFDNPFFLAI